MTTRAQKVRLGFFLIASTLLLFGTIATLIGLTVLNPRDYYKVRFADSVGGLTPGSSVKMKGVRVGQVDKMEISEDAQQVLVTLALTPGTPVKQGTKAVINSIGITGLMEIEISGGTASAPLITPNRPDSFIDAGDSVIQTLTGKAIDIGKKTEQVLNNMIALTEESYRVRVRSLLENADKLASTWAEIADENRTRIKRILRNADKGSSALEKAAQSVEKVATTSGGALHETLVEAGKASRSMARILQNFHPQSTFNMVEAAARALRDRLNDPAMKELPSSVGTAANRLAKLTGELDGMVRRRDRQVGSILDKLDDTMSNLRSFSKAIKERPSLLLRGETFRERDVP